MPKDKFMIYKRVPGLYAGGEFVFDTMAVRICHAVDSEQSTVERSVDETVNPP